MVSATACWRGQPSRVLYILLSSATLGLAFALPSSSPLRQGHRSSHKDYCSVCRPHQHPKFTTAVPFSKICDAETDAWEWQQQLSNRESSYTYQPLFSFDQPETALKFSRIDDVIMGGVSSSKLVNIPGTDFAKWFGICRIEGGGFCGIRTLPFEEALHIPPRARGLYLKCRLVSDNEPERRVWKVTTRTKDDRGEQLYQARYYFSPAKDNTASTKMDGSDHEHGQQEPWSMMHVPFESFQFVRGPRTVPNAPLLDTTSGLYQIGLTMSKFELGANVTELPNFRPGFFEYHLQSIGMYYGNKDDGADYANDKMAKETTTTTAPVTEVNVSFLSEKQARQKAPLLLQLLRPVGNLFFTEQSQRRKVAMQLLREKRGLSRAQAMMYGFSSRSKSLGVGAAAARLLAIVTVDSLRGSFFLAVRILLLWPLKMVQRTTKVLLAKASLLPSSDISMNNATTVLGS